MKLSPVKREVLRRLNDPTWGVGVRLRSGVSKPSPVSIFEAESIPEPPKPEPVMVPAPLQIATATLAKYFKKRPEPKPAPFVWDRSKVLAPSDVKCVFCRGTGVSWGRGLEPCRCVFRRIFRICLRQYQLTGLLQANYSTACVLTQTEGHGSCRFYSRPKEEYRADFCVVSKRSLKPDQWRLFRLHMLDGHDWKYCTEALGIDRGLFFHWVYQIQAKLGRIFCELRPHALYPIDEYMAKTRGVPEAKVAA